jgi:hypothetical protein
MTSATHCVAWNIFFVAQFAIGGAERAECGARDWQVENDDTIFCSRTFTSIRDAVGAALANERLTPGVHV